MADFDFSNLTVEECVEAKALLDDRLQALQSNIVNYPSIEQKLNALRNMRIDWATFLNGYGVSVSETAKIDSGWVDKFKEAMDGFIEKFVSATTTTELEIKYDKIRNYCFNNHPTLERLIIPNVALSWYNNKPKWNGNLLEGCTTIKYVDASNTSSMGIGQESLLLASQTMSFLGNCSVEEIVLNENIKYIGCGALENNYNLSKLTNALNIHSIYPSGCWNTGFIEITEENFPNLKSIYARGFLGSTKLTKIDSSVITRVEDNAFQDCKSLTTVNLPNVEFDNNTNNRSGITGIFMGCTNLTNVALNENLTLLPNSMFYKCTSLKRFEHNGITTLGIYTSDTWADSYMYCFASCTSLEEVILPNLTTITDGKIGAYTFSNCTNLKTFYTPKLLNVIPSYCFYKCSSLVNLNINYDGITEIGANAFNGCKLIEQFIFKNCTVVNNGVFTECTALKYVGFPSATNIRAILPSATALEAVHLGNITSLVASTITYANNLKAIIMTGITVVPLATTSETTSSNPFRYCYKIKGTYNATYNPNSEKTTFFYVNDDMVASYQSATNWSTIKTQIKPISELPEEYKFLLATEEATA